MYCSLQWSELEALVQITIKTVIALFLSRRSTFHKILYWPCDTAEEKAIARSSVLSLYNYMSDSNFLLTFLMDEDKILYEGIPLQ